MDEDFQIPKRSRRKSDNWIWWVLGGAVLLYLVNSGSVASLPSGPTSYPDPLTSVQAGGANFGQTTNSLAVVSSQGPYAMVG